MELNPITVDLITVALKQGHTVTACPACSGPEIHSLTRPVAKCFRCFRYRETESVQEPPRRMKCQRCKKFFKSRVDYKTCPDCRGKLAKRALEPEGPIVMKIRK